MQELLAMTNFTQESINTVTTILLALEVIKWAVSIWILIFILKSFYTICDRLHKIAYSLKKINLVMVARENRRIQEENKEEEGEYGDE